MPRAIVTEDRFNWAGDVRPTGSLVPHGDLRNPRARRQHTPPGHTPAPARHLRALSDRSFIDHLKKLGVTTLELLPIHAFVQDRFLLERGLRNYWGYSTLSFFAPEPSYLSGQPGDNGDEVRNAVRRLHAAGIEVILDVVFNHTAGGNELGPTISLRGLDNASYFRLLPGQERYYIDDTGCGNTLNVSHPRVLQMVLDSLRYWATSYRVDGFRFDLGVTLGREGTGFDPGSGFFDAILQDPLLSQLKLISEPWDLGPGGYQLGKHPPPFAEWNDQFRDDVRRFWRGDVAQRSALAARLSGSAELFNHRWRKSWASVNFVASHDGFTLRDIVSYTEKHNEANKENGNDGHSENHSANWGVEGPTDDPADQRHPRQGQPRHAGHALLLTRHTHAAGRGRIWPHPARQQQRLLPGQRNILAGLETARNGRGPGVAQFRAPSLAGTPQFHDAAGRQLPQWRYPGAAGA
jgi:isoamylase